MKYGLMIYQHTHNIGDDVQSYAVEQFLPKIDVIVDREKLDTFCCDDDQVAIVLNGWFMDHKYNWPPSPYLYPLLISMHFSYNGGDIVTGDSFLDGLGGEYLRQHGPVGARDGYTLELLRGKSIPVYLSGCMTLTLQGKPDVERSDELLLIDTDSRVAQYLDTKGIKYTTSTNKVSYGSHDFWPARRKKVEDYLEHMQRAKCVVTTRLHAALPCLALGTPVLMLYEDAFYDRVGSFLPYLHHCSVDQFCTGQANFDVEHPPANSEDYHPFCDSLIATVKTFVDSIPKLPQATVPHSSDFYQLWVEKAVFQKQLIENASNRYQKVIDEQVMWNHQLEEAKSYLEQNNQDLRHECARLEAENLTVVAKKNELFQAKQLTDAECSALREEAERAEEVWKAKQALEAECAKLKQETEHAKEVWEAKQALEEECAKLKQEAEYAKEVWEAKLSLEAECATLKQEAEHAKEVWEAKQALEEECATLKQEAEHAKEVWEAKQALEAQCVALREEAERAKEALETECIQLKRQCDALINKRFSNQVKRMIKKLRIINNRDS